MIYIIKLAHEIKISTRCIVSFQNMFKQWYFEIYDFFCSLRLLKSSLAGCTHLTLTSPKTTLWHSNIKSYDSCKVQNDSVAWPFQFWGNNMQFQSAISYVLGMTKIKYERVNMLYVTNGIYTLGNKCHCFGNNFPVSHMERILVYFVKKMRYILYIYIHGFHCTSGAFGSYFCETRSGLTSLNAAN